MPVTPRTTAFVVWNTSQREFIQMRLSACQDPVVRAEEAKRRRGITHPTQSLTRKCEGLLLRADRHCRGFGKSPAFQYAASTDKVIFAPSSVSMACFDGRIGVQQKEGNERQDEASSPSPPALRFNGQIGTVGIAASVTVHGLRAAATHVAAAAADVEATVTAFPFAPTVESHASPGRNGPALSSTRVSRITAKCMLQLSNWALPGPFIKCCRFPHVAVGSFANRLRHQVRENSHPIGNWDEILPV
ncbi:hypothetical protein HPB50_005763 [Hyalomma asiaticum]|uniref:Uncharacterized protein n=1 Tax=Hyalomma asiaticum TaxID=266040 RepID=A0ACB7TCJ3_HYAAI|nr:hypothetical protein HPB50_005763 [Hyalomma asiaticum]